MAGALSRRDIEMIFRAETDKATRPIGELTRDVKALRGALEEQLAAANRGEVSLDKLAETTRDLKKAQDELGTARSLLTQLNGQEKALAAAEARLASATAKYDALGTQIAGAEAPTKRLTQQFEAAGRAQAAAAESLDRVRAQTAETRQQIEGIIGPVENTSNAFRDIAVNSREISRGLAIAGTAADEFKGKLAGLTAEQAKAAADRSFNQQGLDAGLLQAQVTYISQFENRVQLLTQAKAELAAQDAAFQRALSAQEAKVGAANVQQLKTAFEEAAAAEERIKQVTAFRQLAADVQAAVTDVTRFGVSADGGAQSADRLATSLLAILQPSKAATATLNGLESTVTQISDSLDGKGRKSAQEYAVALNGLTEAGASIGRIAQSIDAFKDQQAAVDAAATAFHAAQSEALKLAADLATTETPTRELAQALRDAEAAVTTTGTALQQEGNKAEALGAKLRRAGVDTANLAKEEERLTQVATEAAAAQAEIDGETNGSSNFLGLNVQDATNLGYQINDIFTQLASGASIFTVLAQQGPQIWQIGGVQAYIAALGPLLPILLAVAAAIALVAATVKRANDRAAELNSATAYVKALGDQGTLTAKQLADASTAMQDLGVSAEDARKLTRDFSNDGLDPQFLEAFTQAAKNAADVTGKDFKDAFEALTGAMKGGYDQVVALNEEFPVLTDAELTQIKAMYDSGDASEARRAVFERFFDKMQEGADNLNGPWSNAVDNFQKAFTRLLDYLGTTTVVKQFIKEIDEALIGLNYLLLRARGFTNEQAGNAAVNASGRAPGQRPRTGGDPGGTRQKSTAAGRAAADDAEREVKAKKRQSREELKQNAILDARRKAQAAGYGADDQARLEAAAGRKAAEDYDARAATRGNAARRRADAAARRDANAAKALANQIDNQADSLATALDQMGSKVAKVAAGTLKDQLSNAATAVELQYQKLFRQLDEFSAITKGRGRIGNLSIEQYREQIKANEVILTQQAQLKVYEDNINDTLKQRQAALANIEDQANRGLISGAEAIRQTQEVTSKFDPLIASLTQAAVLFAKSIAGASPSAELQAFIAKMESLGQRNAGDGQASVRDSAQSNLGREEAKLNQILAERNSLVETYNTLAQLGVITQEQARRKSADAFNASKGLIDQQIAQTQQTLAAARAAAAGNAPLLLQYDALAAKLNLVAVQAQYADPRLVQLKGSIDGLITQNALTAIDKIAESFAGAIAGTQTWGDALVNAGLAFLEFIGNTILGIARLILQMIILSAIEKITGIPVAALLQFNAAISGGGGGKTGLFHGGGEVGSYAGGQQTTTRQISPLAFALAPRYHEGTPSVGLKPNEQAAVLQKGEKVVTEEQQRLENKRANQPAGGRGLRQVLAFGDDQVAAAMAGPAGEDVTVTHIRRNTPLIKQLLES
jgi:hypothetical protein